MEDMNLRVAAIAFPTRRGYDVPDDLERRVLATQEAMRFAADLRADVIILRTGRIPGESEALSSSRLVESLTALGVFGNHIGVRPALQTADVAPADLLRLIQALPDQTVGVDLNPSELIKAGHSPRETVELLGSHVLHVHACDAVRDIVTRDGIEVELGRGCRRYARASRPPHRIRLPRLGHHRTPRLPQPHRRNRKRRRLPAISLVNPVPFASSPHRLRFSSRFYGNIAATTPPNRTITSPPIGHATFRALSLCGGIFAQR